VIDDGFITQTHVDDTHSVQWYAVYTIS
jgi:hypothetical protein